MTTRQLPDIPPVLAVLSIELLQLGLELMWSDNFGPHLDIRVSHSRPLHRLSIRGDKVVIAYNDFGHERSTRLDLCDPELVEQLRTYFRLH